MPETIAILGASGKLGGATLAALLAHDLAPPATTTIVALTSSAPGSAKWASLASQGGREVQVQVRHASFEDPASLEAALQGVTTFFLVSTPDIALDFADPATGAPLGPGRDAHHRRAIDAAARAGVRRLVYSSLAFAFARDDDGAMGGRDQSRAGVMRAHLRTEAYLREIASGAPAFKEVVAIREGLYSESWPLYLGYFAGDGSDARSAVKLAGDGKVCWTAIADLGIASALVLVAPPGTYASSGSGAIHSFYLSTRPATARTVREVAALVAEARGREVRVEIVGRDEHVRHYVEDRGLEAPAVRWWASTYDALEAGECLVDDPTLEELLARVGVKPTPFEVTVRRMVKGGGSGNGKGESS
ncbi:hypothetical protein SLS62_010424 [Diatrype stigma]|uniref:NmrA-like domain-containing protein n=1 Tax=Diatrype stigma TaxID=117547 RepID=A0AAN9UA30_9PEZI